MIKIKRQKSESNFEMKQSLLMRRIFFEILEKNSRNALLAQAYLLTLHLGSRTMEKMKSNNFAKGKQNKETKSAWIKCHSHEVYLIKRMPNANFTFFQT